MNKFLSKEFIFFCSVGFLGFFFDYIFFKFFFKFFDANIFFIKFLSTFLAITLTFFLNRLFSFKNYLAKLKFRNSKEYTLYFLIQGIGGGINFLSFSFLIMMHPELRSSPFIPIAISAIFVSILNFSMLKFFLYNKSE
jgi:putative flippase GtrA